MRRIGHESQLGGIQESVLQGGRSRGMRILTVRTGSGLEFTVAPDRFMDVIDARFNGASLAWISPAGAVHPAYYEPSGNGWLQTFGGGLLTTCGLTQVGEANQYGGVELGLHGRASTIPAEEVSYASHWEGDQLEWIIRGTMREARLFGDVLVCHREIRAQWGSSKLRITDTVENQGYERSPLMVLYHCNLGYPLVDAGARVVVNSERVEARDAEAQQGLDAWSHIGPPVAGWREQVFVHSVRPGANGWTSAAIVNPAFRHRAGIGLALRWRVAELPYLMQWKMLGEGAYVMGLEPANCHVLGRTAEGAAGRLQYLLPGASQSFALELEVLADSTSWEAQLPRVDAHS